MSEEKAKPAFNPTWVMVAIAIGSGGVSGITSSAINSRDVAELKVKSVEAEQRFMQIERRFAENEKTGAVATVALQKDLEALSKGMSEIRGALMVSGVQRTGSRNNTP